MITKTLIIPAENNEVVTLSAAKDHLKVDGNAEDSLIGIYLSAAQLSAENYIGRAVGMQVLEMHVTGFEDIVFSSSSNDEIETIKYYGVGSEDLAAYESGFTLGLETLGNRTISFAEGFPVTGIRNDAVIVKVKRGYMAASCPKPIIAAILLTISDLYERREDRPEVGYNTSVNNLLRPYKKW